MATMLDTGRMRRQSWEVHRSIIGLPHDAVIHVPRSPLVYHDQAWNDPMVVPDWYRINHSSAPNVMPFVTNPLSPKKCQALAWKTLRRVKQGEELRFQYTDAPYEWDLYDYEPDPEDLGLRPMPDTKGPGSCSRSQCEFSCSCTIDEWVRVRNERETQWVERYRVLLAAQGVAGRLNRRNARLVREIQKMTTTSLLPLWRSKALYCEEKLVQETTDEVGSPPPARVCVLQSCADEGVRSTRREPLPPRGRMRFDPIEPLEPHEVWYLPLTRGVGGQWLVLGHVEQGREERWRCLRTYTDAETVAKMKEQIAVNVDGDLVRPIGFHLRWWDRSRTSRIYLPRGGVPRALYVIRAPRRSMGRWGINENGLIAESTLRWISPESLSHHVQLTRACDGEMIRMIAEAIREHTCAERSQRRSPTSEETLERQWL